MEMITVGDHQINQGIVTCTTIQLMQLTTKNWPNQKHKITNLSGVYSSKSIFTEQLLSKG